MNKKIILFDLGDTLITLSPSKEELFVQAAKKINLSIDIDSVRSAYHIVDFHFKYSSISINDYNKKKKFYDLYNYKICEILGIISYYEKLNQFLISIFKAKKEWKLFNDAKIVLDNLYKKSHELVIIANWDNDIINLTKKLGIYKYFKLIVSSQIIGIEKPDPEVFNKTLEKLDYYSDKNKIIYIGNDYSLDIISARQAGLLPILIDRYNFYPFADCLRFDSLKVWYNNFLIKDFI